MKKLYYIIIPVFIFALIGFSNEKRATEIDAEKNNSNPIKKISKVISDKKLTKQFANIRLFGFQNTPDQNDNVSSFVSKAAVLKLKSEQVLQTLKNKNENILFSIPLSEKNSLELELTQSFPLSTDFSLISKDGVRNTVKSYEDGLHYNGIIKGKENSIASISIFNNFVMGIISDESGNYVLGPIKNSDNSYSDQYIFYNDADLIAQNNFKCGVDGNEKKLTLPFKENKNYFERHESTDDIQQLPVKVYFEADYQMYLDMGGNEQMLGNFITGMFNFVKTIYQNESIPFEISQIGYWSSDDPYENLTDPSQILISFGANTQDNFQGNLAHFISTRNDSLGGIAWIRVLCEQYDQQSSAGRFAFSDIDPDYNTFPVYSWTVNVITHEMGHNLGSMHTQACVWPVGGFIGAIDSCYYSEGGCFSDNQIHPTVGTIMSYCHLWRVSQGGGVNLALGFGPLPGDTIRLRYSQASCLDRTLNSSEQPSSFDLSQNFPNPFNPVTKIEFAVPVNSNVSIKIYDVTGKLAADLIHNKFYETGFHKVTFNSAEYNLSSGIYFYSLLSDGNLIDTKRMVLIK